MQFGDDSGRIVKAMLPKFNKCENYKDLSRREEKSLDRLLLNIYREIVKGYKYVQDRISAQCLKATLKGKESLAKPTIYNSRFFPSHIRDHVNEHMKHQLVYNCSVGGRDVSIKFAIFSGDEIGNFEKYEEYARMMYAWLYICGENAPRRCARSLNIYVFPTPFRKSLPSSSTGTIGPDNVNTAVTFSCARDGDMVIFRQEEWLKVFIHETFHSYGLDFSHHNYGRMKGQVREIFPVDSEFDIAEAYTETWARIINGGFAAYHCLKDKSDEDTFLLYMKFSLQMERLFALAQVNKVLGFMGLTYENLHGFGEANAYLRKNMYREKTNVLSYYVISAIFLNSYYEFLTWCSTHNPNYMTFNVSETNLDDLVGLIEAGYTKDTFIDGLRCTKTLFANKRKGAASEFLRRTTRMSAIEVIC